MEQQQEREQPQDQAGKQQVSSGQTHSGQHPALEPHCDDRARQGESGEGDRTDTDEMHQVSRS